jgi:hypothetical protein
MQTKTASRSCVDGLAESVWGLCLLLRLADQGDDFLAGCWGKGLPPRIDLGQIPRKCGNGVGLVRGDWTQAVILPTVATFRIRSDRPKHRTVVLRASVSADRSQLISGDEISSAEREASVDSAPQVGPTRR